MFGLGPALMVAPLTATVLATAPDEHTWIAAGSTTPSCAGLLALRGGVSWSTIRSTVLEE